MSGFAFSFPPGLWSPCGKFKLGGEGLHWLYKLHKWGGEERREWGMQSSKSKDDLAILLKDMEIFYRLIIRGHLCLIQAANCAAHGVILSRKKANKMYQKAKIGGLKIRKSWSLRISERSKQVMLTGMILYQKNKTESPG